MVSCKPKFPLSIDTTISQTNTDSLYRGFNLAQSSRHNIGYAVVIVIVFGLLIAAALFQMRRRRRQEAFNTPAAQNFRNGEYPQPSANEIPLQPTYGPPPAYDRPTGA